MHISVRRIPWNEEKLVFTVFPSRVCDMDETRRLRRRSALDPVSRETAKGIPLPAWETNFCERAIEGWRVHARAETALAFKWRSERGTIELPAHKG